MDILKDTEELLNTHEHFQMGAWIAEARNKSKTEKVQLNLARYIPLNKQTDSSRIIGECIFPE